MNAKVIDSTEFAQATQLITQYKLDKLDQSLDTKQKKFSAGKNEKLTAKQARDFFEQFRQVAKVESKKNGIPVSILLVTAMVMSRTNSNELADLNNPFGIKCFSSKCKKGHCKPLAGDHKGDYYMQYSSPELGWQANSKMLKSVQYDDARRQDSYRKCAYALEVAGYFDDFPNGSEHAANRVIGLIENYELHRYDL